MAYIELYNDKIFDLINLGKTISDFNPKNGDYIKVELFSGDNINVLQTFYSNRLLLQYPDNGGYYTGEYHYHPESPDMGFCEGKIHTKESTTQLQPIPLTSIDDPMNGESQFEKQVKVFKDDKNNIYIKPNEIIKLGEYSGGKYRLRIHFLRDIKSTIGNYFKLMENNLIENANFFAGLEATQTGDLDKSSGKNNFIRMYNPGYSPYVLNQSGLPSNDYVMWVTGVKPNKNYVFSCWVAWDSEYNGDYHIGCVESPMGEPLLFQDSKTTIAGSYIAEEEDATVGGRILKQTNAGGVMWYKLYMFVQTKEEENFDSVYIYLGKNNENFSPSMKPLGGRYFTDLRFEEVETFTGEPIQNYLNKLQNEDSKINGAIFTNDLVSTTDETMSMGSEYEVVPGDTIESGELPITNEILGSINVEDILSQNLGSPVDDSDIIDEGINNQMNKGGRIKR